MTHVLPLLPVRVDANDFLTSRFAIQLAFSGPQGESCSFYSARRLMYDNETGNIRQSTKGTKLGELIDMVIEELKKLPPIVAAIRDGKELHILPHVGSSLKRPDVAPDNDNLHPDYECEAKTVAQTEVQIKVTCLRSTTKGLSKNIREEASLDSHNDVQGYHMDPHPCVEWVRFHPPLTCTQVLSHAKSVGCLADSPLSPCAVVRSSRRLLLSAEGQVHRRCERRWHHMAPLHAKADARSSSRSSSWGLR